MKKLKKTILIAFSFAICALALLPVIRNSEDQELNVAVQKKLPGSFIALSKGSVHYQTGGDVDSQPVVLVHGFSVPMYIYDSTFNALVNAGFRVLRFDLWGRGYSSRPLVDYNLDLFIEEVRELADSLRLAKPIDLVGVSMGGTIVAGFASKYPGLVRNVILIDPHAIKKNITPVSIPLIGDYFAAAFRVPSLPQS
jgi:pimeloyl-ACP methyl ester carboxylesterase